MFTALLLSLLAGLPARAELHNESEAGVVIATGNSRSQSLSFKEKFSYEWGRNVLGLRGSFLQTKSLGVLSAKRWDIQLRYERNFSDRFSLIFAQSVQSDRFAGYQQRYNTDFGPKYVIYRVEGKWEWVAEGGYRYSKERKLDASRDIRQQGRIFTELKRQWSETASSGFYVEFVPSFRDFSDWELKSELSSTAAFNSIFSLKAAYLLKYDNVPAVATAQKRDTEFTTSLVAKF